MTRLNMKTPNLTDKNIERIAALFPNVITEMEDENGHIKKGINFELLRLELSGDIADNGGECYSFTWAGKKQAILEGNMPIRKTLRPCKEESKDWETTGNLYIEGDNLDVLKLLQDSYLNSIKMIYIDPPYNTGSDFIYKDDFTVSRKKYKEQAGFYDDNDKLHFQDTESKGRFHSDWCSLLYPRLKLARNLLSEDGVIFISIDDNELHNLRKICDEVFGEGNFINTFLWTKTSTPPSLSNKSRTTVEYVLCYEKTRNNLKYYGSDLENGDAPLLNSGNPVKTLTFPPQTINFSYIRNTKYKAGRYGKVELLNDITVEDGKNINNAVLSGEFKWTGDTLSKEIGEGTYFIIRSEKFSIRFQRSSNNKRFKAPNNYIDELELNKGNGAGTNESAVKELDALGLKGLFDYPKPTSLIKKLANMVTYDNKDCIVLDFFSGSGTTAQSIMQLNAEDDGNRKFIMVQLPEKCDESSEVYKAGYKTIAEIGKERIRRAGEQIKKDIELSARQSKIGEAPKKVPDIGFRVLKADSKNMKDVYYTTGEHGHNIFSALEPNIKEGRTDMDLLYQVLLNCGLPLGLRHVTEKICGVKVHIIDDGALIACFEANMPESAVREIANRKPLRAVFCDSSFSNSPGRINAEEIFKLNTPGTDVRII